MRCPCDKRAVRGSHPWLPPLPELNLIRFLAVVGSSGRGWLHGAAVQRVTAFIAGWQEA